MMAHEMIGRGRHARAGRPHGAVAPLRVRVRDNASQALAWRKALEEAAALLHDNPDAAALALEGALRQLVNEWYARQGLHVPPARDLLADLEARDAPLAWRLRLALRAPHVEARLAHARGLEQEIVPRPQPLPGCGGRSELVSGMSEMRERDDVGVREPPASEKEWAY